jgi:putative endonuclease
MWWYVYLLQNETTKEIYIGRTKDLKRRLKEHNRGRSKFTKRKGKWKLIYVEAYSNEKDAVRREKRLKYHGRAKQELLKRIKNCHLS